MIATPAKSGEMVSPAGKYIVSSSVAQRRKVLKSLVRKYEKEGKIHDHAVNIVFYDLLSMEGYYKKRDQEKKHPSWSKRIGEDIDYFIRNFKHPKSKTRQTPAGKHTIRASNQDGELKAKKPGKRTSKTGKIYYERRYNRSDNFPNSKKGERF